MMTNDKGETEQQREQKQKKKQLPVIVAGAGPCGLVAALTLQQKNIPFIIYERASRERLCSNSGSGIDMAPTAVSILDTKLGVNMTKAMRPYDSMYVGSTKGCDEKNINNNNNSDNNNNNDDNKNNKKKKTNRRPYSTYNLKDLPNSIDFGFANRSDLQNALLDSLFATMDSREKEKEDYADSLCCNTEVTEYVNKDDRVQVTILTRDSATGDKTESIVEGSALLACDGIHSAIRKHMHRDSDDEYNYVGQVVWWGKTEITPGSELDQQLDKIQREEKLSGSMAVSFLGGTSDPCGFFSCYVSDTTHAWAYYAKHSEMIKSNQSDDLVRRGGTVLDEETKRRELVEPFAADKNKVMQLFIRDTKATDITRAGFFDRKDLNLPYVDHRVALLGDAAHPQSPMMGQGANMAIVDGYVVGTRLAAALTTATVASTDNSNDNGSGNNDDGVRDALSDFDCNERRNSVNKVIKTARFITNLAVTNNTIKDWLMKTILKYSPPSMVIKQMVSGDISNKVFVDTLERDMLLLEEEEKKKKEKKCSAAA